MVWVVSKTADGVQILLGMAVLSHGNFDRVVETPYGFLLCFFKGERGGVLSGWIMM